MENLPANKRDKFHSVGGVVSVMADFKAGYVKVMIHKTDEKSFEILESESFSLSLSQEHSCLDEEIGTLGFEYILGDIDSIFPEMKIDQVGELLAAVHIEYSKFFTDCGYEYDVAFDLQELKTKLYSEEESLLILQYPRAEEALEKDGK